MARGPLLACLSAGEVCGGSSMTDWRWDLMDGGGMTFFVREKGENRKTEPNVGRRQKI